MDYASFIFDDSSDSHFKKLERIQNQALHTIGGYIKSTPTHVMESDLCVKPLNIRIRIRRYYLADKFWLKSKSIRNYTLVSLLDECTTNNTLNSWRRKKKPLLTVVHDLLKDVKIYQSELI